MKIKHLLTKRCHVGCYYCLEKNVKIKQVNDPKIIMHAYKELYERGYTVIDLTGGEPTMHPNYCEIALHAATVFDEVHLYTADWHEYNKSITEEVFTTVNYGWHDKLVGINELEKIKIAIPVYMQTMAYHYTPDLPYQVKELGFSGLSVNTNKHLTDSVFDAPVPIIDGFSIKINDNEYYAHSALLMPNLSIVEGVGQFLDKNIA